MEFFCGEANTGRMELFTVLYDNTILNGKTINSMLDSSIFNFNYKSLIINLYYNEKAEAIYIVAMGCLKDNNIDITLLGQSVLENNGLK